MGELLRAAERGERHRTGEKRPEAAPGEIARLAETVGGKRGNQDVERECGRPHHFGCHADQGHSGNVSRSAGVADGGVGNGHAEEQHGENDDFVGGHDMTMIQEVLVHESA